MKFYSHQIIPPGNFLHIHNYRNSSNDLYISTVGLNKLQSFSLNCIYTCVGDWSKIQYCSTTLE